MTAGDVVVVQVVLSPQSVYARAGGSSYHASFLTNITSTGMSFQQRFAYTANPGSGDGSLVWEDYAIAPVSETATITAGMNSTLAAWGLVGYSVKGADTLEPFDTNPSIPNGDFNDCNLVDGCGVAFSTTANDTMIIAGIGSEGCPTMVPPGAFTLIGQACGQFGITDAVAYQLVSSPQTDSYTGSWGMTGLSCTQNATNSCGESALWYVDAIQACPGPGSCPVPATAVVQPVSVDMSNSAPSANVTVNGCQATPSTFRSDGESHPVLMLPDCTFTLSFSNSGERPERIPRGGVI